MIYKKDDGNWDWNSMWGPLLLILFSICLTILLNLK